MRSGSNNFNYFSANRLSKFSAVQTSASALSGNLKT